MANETLNYARMVFIPVVIGMALAVFSVILSNVVSTGKKLIRVEESCNSFYQRMDHIESELNAFKRPGDRFTADQGKRHQAKITRLNERVNALTQRVWILEQSK